MVCLMAIEDGECSKYKEIKEDDQDEVASLSSKTYDFEDLNSDARYLEMICDMYDSLTSLLKKIKWFKNGT